MNPQAISPQDIQELQAEFDKLRDIAQAQPYPPPPFPWEIWVVIALILVVGLMIWKFYKNKPSKPAPLKTALELALEALETLKTKNLIEQNRLKEFVYEVNIILRRFLENQFQIKAPEQTTEEFLASKLCQQALNQDHWERFRSFLESCDLVKYANRPVEKSESQILFEQADQLIREIAREETHETP